MPANTRDLRRCNRSLGRKPEHEAPDFGVCLSGLNSVSHFHDPVALINQIRLAREAPSARYDAKVDGQRSLRYRHESRLASGSHQELAELSIPHANRARNCKTMVLEVQNRDTQPPATSESPCAGASWWVWLAWIERENGGGFVYGAAARCFHEPDWSEEAGFEIPGADRLVVRQCTVRDDNFGLLRNQLAAGTVDTAPLQPSKVIQAKIIATRGVFRDALGQSGVRTALHYTVPNVEVLIGTADGALERVLSTLEEQLNLPFKGAYAGHLGNFEIFELHPWLDAPRPFLIEAVPDSNPDASGPLTMEICRSAEFAVAGHTAHFVGRVHGEVIFDRLIKLPPGERRVPFQIQEKLDQFDFRLFGDDGEALLHSEQLSFINRIGFVMAPVNRQMTIEDDLSNRAKSKNKGLGAQAAGVVVHSAHRSMINAPRAGSWLNFAEDMEQKVATHLPKSSEDRWFPRGIEGEVGAIAHLAHLINAGQIARAVLVDPWFGADALQRIVMRVGSQGIPLTILTSWTDTDPDTGLDLDPAESPTAKLEAALRRAEPFLVPRLTMLNLVDGKDRAFHDRYLLLYPHENPPKVFLLSTSINNLAGNWPFAMSLLASDVSREVQRYIEALCDGRDNARNKSLTVSFKWPPDATT
jgi:hypothetical protein